MQANVNAEPGQRRRINIWGCPELSLLRAGVARRVALLISGQVLSLLLVTTGATSALLVGRGLKAPSLAALCNYLMLATFYNAVLLSPWGKQRRGLFALWTAPEEPRRTHDRFLVPKFVLFAVADVEANYLIVRAYQNAPMTNITLLDSLTIPTVVFLSAVFLGVKYARNHIWGIVLCLFGMLALVLQDMQTSNAATDRPASNILGDLMAISAAILYGISNILQEHLALRFGCAVVLARLGIAGAMISAVQLSLMQDELASIKAFGWSPSDVGLLAGFVFALWVFYSLTPALIVLAGSAFFNLSLLSSDFWAAAFGAFFFLLGGCLRCPALPTRHPPPKRFWCKIHLCVELDLYVQREDNLRCGVRAYRGPSMRDSAALPKACLTLLYAYTPGALVLGESLSATYLLSFILTVGGLAVYHMHGEPLREGESLQPCLVARHLAGDGDRTVLTSAPDGDDASDEAGDWRQGAEPGDADGWRGREVER